MDQIDMSKTGVGFFFGERAASLGYKLSKGRIF